MPTRILDQSAPPDTDPLGYTRTSIDYMPDRVPRNYPRDTCHCSDCVDMFVRAQGITADRYNAAAYREHPSFGAHRWAQDMSSYLGQPWPEGLTHRRRQTRWARYEQELPLASHFDAIINRPLRYILKRSGRIWSAEVEVNEVSVSQASRVLGVSEGRYSARPDRPSIVVAPDGTVDAEIKISCMRDGSDVHADMALGTYAALTRAGARAAANAGHHVHVDGTRLADLGTEATEQVMAAAWKAARVCTNALMPLAASGYSKHRGSSTQWSERAMLTSRQPLHGSRLWSAAQRRTDSNATIEYRLPNATLSPLRAQSFIAIPLGILDFAERAVLDEDTKAAEMLRQVEDKLAHATTFDEVTATQFLLDALKLSKDSRKCLALAAYTSPSCSAKARRLWEDATEGMTKLESIERNAQTSEARKKTPKGKETPARVRDESGRFASSAFVWPPQARNQAEAEAQLNARRDEREAQLFTFNTTTSAAPTLSASQLRSRVRWDPPQFIDPPDDDEPGYTDEDDD